METPKYDWVIMHARRDNTAYRFDIWNMKTNISVEVTIPRENMDEDVAADLWVAFQTGFPMSEKELFALCKMTKTKKHSS